jgi:beta-glucosidase
MVTTVQAGEPVEVQAQVTNTGRVAGDEVAQLYLVQPKGDGTPLRELAGFQRLHLAPGESREVTFTLSPRSLSQVDAQGKHVILPGQYRVFIGGSQPTGDGKGIAFSVTGRAEQPE